jgi:hypothetical protein
MGVRARMVGFVVAASACVAVPACGLDAVGLFSAEEAEQDAGDERPGVEDAPSPADGGTEAEASCPTSLANLTGQLAVPRTTTAMAVDGVLDDWPPCLAFVRMDRDSGIWSTSVDGGVLTNRVEFGALWDDGGIYFAARVFDPLVEGANDVEQYKNDSIELYLDADGNLTGEYTVQDHQYVLDHRNVGYDFGYFPSRPIGAGVARAVSKDGGAGFTVEMRIPKEELGLSTLGGGMTLGLDVASNDADGTNRFYHVYWHHAPACTCMANCCCGQAVDHPFCNTQRFGRMTLGN